MSADNKNTAAATAPTDRPKNNVRVGGQRSKFVYADLTKHLLNDGEKEVVITALNASISDAVAVVEMLKSQKLVKVTKIQTSRGQEETARRPGSDKIEIVVTKDKDFDKIYAEQQKEREAKKAEKDAEKK
eukprot:GILJ01012878.1.p1 GENE.GILJ01012878.1~~GILJ01012878.1.p1  ORF type:complete len:151 (-),score=48.63 GILJ01012878.1:278-667(-)